jgi:hypothetical protein
MASGLTDEPMLMADLVTILDKLDMNTLQQRRQVSSH